MDSFLIDYLRSGNAWLLVGSGPSTAMGYPTWGGLAEAADKLVAREHGRDKELAAALATRDFPRVFERARAVVGGGRLLQELRRHLTPRRAGRAYEAIATWPIRVYLTTNYDDEIFNHLVQLGEAYIQYGNSEDNLALLDGHAAGIICKLHGDLRSANGLVLTSPDYHSISNSDRFRYWRTKLTSIFQLQQVVVIGHSLTDPDVQHILAAAKEGAGVNNPVCWLAPDVPLSQGREFLEKWRIRVIPYENRDGTHDNLVRLLETVSDFVPPRVSVRASQDVAAVAHEPDSTSQAAASLFVFNRLAGEKTHEERRVDVVLAALQSAHAVLGHAPFDLTEGLKAARWPEGVPVLPEFKRQLTERATQQNILSIDGNTVAFTEQSIRDIAVRADAFNHLRDRFLLALELRLKREFPNLEEPKDVAAQIESALVGFFRHGGLTLATTLFADTNGPRRHLPASMARFITDASTQYDDLLMRQAFSKVSLDAFVRAGDAEREYLARLSQGFFAFHALGVYGGAALERLKHAKGTVWLVDSNVQIAAVAVGAPVHQVWSASLAQLRQMGLRFFTTERLFEETFSHLRFAQTVVEQKGPRSDAVYAAAVGDAPYRKSNLFLQGFIGWQAAGNPCDWEMYLTTVGNRPDASRKNLEEAIGSVGLEIVALPDWPGYQTHDQARARSLAEDIAERAARRRDEWELDPDEWDEMLRKAGPESEAVMIALEERAGRYFMLSEAREPSPAWFVSQTSMLNKLTNEKVTWQPEAFLRFASALSPGGEREYTDRAFEALLWAVAQTGVNVLDAEAAERVFGGVVDHGALRLSDQMRAYEGVLAEKYGEAPAELVRKMRGVDQTLAVIQLANEAAQRESSARARAQQEAAEWRKKAVAAERELKTVERYRRKVAARQGKAKKQRGRKRGKK